MQDLQCLWMGDLNPGALQYLQRRQVDLLYLLLTEHGQSGLESQAREDHSLLLYD